MTKFLQLLFQGFALGAQYALVALGFVVIYKATRVINFAQGGLVVLGAYFAYNFHRTWDLITTVPLPRLHDLTGQFTTNNLLHTP